MARFTGFFLNPTDRGHVSARRICLATGRVDQRRQCPNAHPLRNGTEITCRFRDGEPGDRQDSRSHA